MATARASPASSAGRAIACAVARLIRRHNPITNQRIGEFFAPTISRTCTASVVADHPTAQPRPEVVDGQHRLAVGLAVGAVSSCTTSSRQPSGVGCFDRRDRVADDATDLHDVLASDLANWITAPACALTVVERRCRVNVSGVVTPSPVGVAMLKLR